MRLYYANSSLKDAQVVVLGLPYDRTSSFIPGSRFGPEYIRLCSENIEDYSPYQEKSLNDIKIHDAGDIYYQTKDWLKETRAALEQIDPDKKFIALGGEHTVTLPVIKWCKERHGDFSLIHFDAHCDLRDQYLGEKICHATVIRRVSEVIGIENVYQFGIRSGTQEEFSFHKNIFKFQTHEFLPDIMSTIKTPVYLSIDVDVLDPGILPAVSTPEPGGINYQQLIDSVLLFNEKKVIGADIVEYNPLAASPWASGSIVAGLLRELILIIGN